MPLISLSRIHRGPCCWLGSCCCAGAFAYSASQSPAASSNFMPIRSSRRAPRSMPPARQARASPAFSCRACASSTIARSACSAQILHHRQQFCSDLLPLRAPRIHPEQLRRCLSAFWRWQSPPAPPSAPSPPYRSCRSRPDETPPIRVLVIDNRAFARLPRGHRAKQHPVPIHVEQAFAIVVPYRGQRAGRAQPLPIANKPLNIPQRRAIRRDTLRSSLHRPEKPRSRCRSLQTAQSACRIRSTANNPTESRSCPWANLPRRRDFHRQCRPRKAAADSEGASAS